MGRPRCSAMKRRAITFLDELEPPQPAVAEPPTTRDPLGCAAEAIRTAWINGMRRLESRLLGRESTYGDHGLGRWDRQQIWRQIAQRCAARRIPPLRLINFVLSRWTTPRLPSPSVLIRAEMLAAYESQPRPTASEFAVEFTIQQEAARLQIYRLRDYNMGLSERELYYYTLLDHSISMSALFRYCLAHQLEMHDVVDRFFAAALDQYLDEHELYERVWGSLIPQSLKDTAREILRQTSA